MRLLVSACLLGLCTRYDGGTSEDGRVLALAHRHTLIPICPEQLGGLSTPRQPCEIKSGRVVDPKGADLTEAFARGAGEALKAYGLCGCKAAVLKHRSPSCGKGMIYDGTFSGKLAAGDGVFAALLKLRRIPVYGEDEVQNIE
ncbi:MAG: DUF523 domain-containing protein [Eubacteriales bacterium]|nr:DUF523 domain-containing protein [Eubacteriales bacterium]